MKKLYFLIILKLIFLSSVSYAQTYQSLNINGFNQDVIANGVGPAASSTTADVDGVSYCFKSMDWQLTRELVTNMPRFNTERKHWKTEKGILIWTGNRLLFSIIHKTIRKPGTYSKSTCQ